MSIHFYTMLKAWRLARHERKSHPAGPPAAGTATGTMAEQRTEAANAAVYAAGIACAGQVGERLR